MSDVPAEAGQAAPMRCRHHRRWNTVAGVFVGLVFFCMGAYAGVRGLSAGGFAHGEEATWIMTGAAGLIGGCAFSLPILLVLLVDLKRYVAGRLTDSTRKSEDHTDAPGPRDGGSAS